VEVEDLSSWLLDLGAGGSDPVVLESVGERLRIGLGEGVRLELVGGRFYNRGGLLASIVSIDCSLRAWYEIPR